MTICLTAISGCGIEPLKTTEVSGNVTLDGEPVEEAMVIFVPHQIVDSTNRKIPISYGVTDKEGNYKLKRMGSGSGAPVGLHMVLIKKSKSGSAKSVDDERNSEILDEIENAINEKMQSLFAGPSARDDELIPAIYNRRSILDFDVKDESNVVADFELSSIDPLLK